MKKIIILFTFVCIHIAGVAQPGTCPPGFIDLGSGCVEDPNYNGGDPSDPVPIDGGASLLLLGGAGIVAYRMKKKKNEEK